MNEDDQVIDATDPQSWAAVTTTKTYVVDADTTPLEAKLSDAERMGKRFSTSLLNAFEAVAIKGKSVSDVFKSLALSLSQMALKTALAPLQQGLATQFTGLFKGLGFAKGGVLNQGTVMPFAQGGVISSPIAFPLSRGMTGIAGERGAEAIMPLTRGRDGRLGVAASGGGSGGITINIATPDVESFRRSEGQVASMIARAAAMGQRNL